MTDPARPGGDDPTPDITPGQEEPTPLTRKENLPDAPPTEPRSPEPTELPDTPPETNLP